MKRPHLLVSVRSVEEALAALDGGAELIDVKEPKKGSLGAADLSIVQDVIHTVRGRVPVSAAMGEWADYVPAPIPQGLEYVKWGLARQPRDYSRIRDTVGVKPVLVAYADFMRCESPCLSHLVETACTLCFPTFLIDTGIKDGSRLLDWIKVDELMRVRERLRASGTKLALAGSLDEAVIDLLGPVQPDWFAVRGAACVGGREGAISTERVRSLRQLIENLNTLHFVS